MSETDKKSPAYSIGQIVYILSTKGQSIIPAMIVEQCTIKTLSGEKVFWKLAMGAKNIPNKPQRIVDSTDINGEIYSSLDAVKRVLQNKLMKFIEDITNQAKKRTELWYGSQLKKVGNNPSVSQNQRTEKIEPEDLLEDLMGTSNTEQDESVNNDITHIHSAERNKANLSADAQKEDLQRRLKELTHIPDDEEEENDGNSQVPMGFIEGPNGTKIPIKLKA